jgi:hypothetical protein
VFTYRTPRVRRWLRWIAAYLAGVSVLAVIGLVIEAGLTSHDGKPQAIPPTSLPVNQWEAMWPRHSATASPTASPALAGPVQVVHGSQEVNGVSLGFPHSTVGAVSAADALASEVGSTLDPDRAAAVMRMVADPSYAQAPQQAASGAARDRTSLGLAAGGPVPQGYDLELSPQEYQVRDVSADRVTVLLLSDIIATTPGGGTTAKVGVFPVALHWAQGDWKALPAPATDYSGLTAEPGSAQAASLGWQELES